MVEQKVKEEQKTQVVDRHITLNTKQYQRFYKYVIKHYRNRRAISMVIGIAIEEYLAKHDIKE
jgi:hypothetical protein